MHDLVHLRISFKFSKSYEKKCRDTRLLDVFSRTDVDNKSRGPHHLMLFFSPVVATKERDKIEKASGIWIHISGVFKLFYLIRFTESISHTYLVAEIFTSCTLIVNDTLPDSISVPTVSKTRQSQGYTRLFLGTQHVVFHFLFPCF